MLFVGTRLFGVLSTWTLNGQPLVREGTSQGIFGLGPDSRGPLLDYTTLWLREFLSATGGERRLYDGGRGRKFRAVPDQSCSQVEVEFKGS